MALSATATRKLVKQGVEVGDIDHTDDLAVLNDWVSNGEGEIPSEVKDALARMRADARTYIDEHAPKPEPPKAGKRQSLKVKTPGDGAGITCQLHPSSPDKDDSGAVVRKYTLRIFPTGADVKDADQVFSASFKGTPEQLEADLAPELSELIGQLTKAIRLYDEADGIVLKYAKLRSVNINDETARESITTAFNAQAARRAKLVQVLGEDGWGLVQDFGLTLT